MTWTSTICLSIFVNFRQVFVRIRWNLKKINSILLHKTFEYAHHIWNKNYFHWSDFLNKVLTVLKSCSIFDVHLIFISKIPTENMILFIRPHCRSVFKRLPRVSLTSWKGNTSQNCWKQRNSVRFFNIGKISSIHRIKILQFNHIRLIQSFTTFLWNHVIKKRLLEGFFFLFFPKHFKRFRDNSSTEFRMEPNNGGRNYRNYENENISTFGHNSVKLLRHSHITIDN